jgi:hypothetical protein
VSLILSPDLSFYGGTWTPRDIRQLNTADVTGLSGYTVVIKIPNSLLTLGTTKCRLHFIGPRNAGNSTVFVNVTISNAAVLAGSDAWDSLATPVPVTFGGSSNLTLLRNHRRMSDEITFTAGASASGGVLVAMDVSSTPESGTSMALRQSKYPATPWPAAYTRAASVQATIANRSVNYTGTGTGGGISYSLTRIDFK